jgi:mono/diheme cytochrome c family protein
LNTIALVITCHHLRVALFCALLLPPRPVSGADATRGRELYARNCLVCHQLNGQGVPGTYPPLAASDYITSHRERAIRALCEGVSGEINVNGRKYNNTMPPVVLNDDEVADVLSFVFSSWGNSAPPVTPGEVQSIRSRTQFPTFAKLQEASAYPPLPQPPPGCDLREVVRMTSHGVRMASDGSGKVIYVLIENGDVWRLEPESGSFRQILWARNYLDRKPGDTPAPLFVLAMALSKDGRLYIGANQPNNLKPPFQNRVTIYRTTSTNDDGDPAEPKTGLEQG